MKRKLSWVLVLSLFIGFTSCDSDLIKTTKFDGEYDCTTYSDSQIDDQKIVIDAFEVHIDMQKLEIFIDGSSRASDIDVNSDGEFTANLSYNLLITEIDITIVGTVTEGGNISGTISELQDVLGINMPLRTGTFSGQN